MYAGTARSGCTERHPSHPPARAVINFPHGLPQPTLVAHPFHHKGWVYEEKVDGYRVVAYKDGPETLPW